MISDVSSKIAGRFGMLFDVGNNLGLSTRMGVSGAGTPLVFLSSRRRSYCACATAMSSLSSSSVMSG